MPELVNMGALGCVGMRLPEGTLVCCLATKKSVQARRNSAEVRGAIGGISLVVTCGFAVRRLTAGPATTTAAATAPATASDVARRRRGRRRGRRAGVGRPPGPGWGRRSDRTGAGLQLGA